MADVRNNVIPFRRPYTARPWRQERGAPFAAYFLGLGLIALAYLILPGELKSGRSVDQLVSLPMPVCGKSGSQTCVVDGDTIRLNGERIRIANIDAPELFSPRCRAEGVRARRATYRLSELMTSTHWSIERSGTDKYGRTLATIHTTRGDAGKVLAAEGLAMIWRGYPANWC